jgi:hypothetical protein
MTGAELRFIKIITTEIGLSLSFKNDKVILGDKELVEPIELEIDYDNGFDFIKHIKLPLKKIIDKLIADDELFDDDLAILKSLIDLL